MICGRDILPLPKEEIKENVKYKFVQITYSHCAFVSYALI